VACLAILGHSRVIKCRSFSGILFIKTKGKGKGYTAISASEGS